MVFVGSLSQPRVENMRFWRNAVNDRCPVERRETPTFPRAESLGPVVQAAVRAAAESNEQPPDSGAVEKLLDLLAGTGFAGF